MAGGEKLGTVTLDVSHVFGSLSTGNFRDAAFYGDEVGRVLITPAGRHAATRHTETGEVTFLLAQPRVEAITACTVSRDKSFLAVCERCSGPIQAQISIFDLKNMPLGGGVPLKVMEPLGRSAGRAVSAAFSSGADSPSRFLSVIYAGTEVSIVVLDWQMDRLVTKHVFQSPLDRVRFSPHDATLLSVSGGHKLRLGRLQNAFSKAREGSVKMLPAFAGLKEDSIRFTDHAWVEPQDGTIVACTADGAAGALYILDTSEMNVLFTLEPVFNDDSGLTSATMPLAVHCFSQGFLVGGGEGTVAVWEKVDTPPGNEAEGAPEFDYKHIRTVKVCDADAGVSSMDMSGSQEYVVFCFRNGDLGFLSTSSLYATPPDELECTLVNGGFHIGPIVGLDMAVQRPLVASAGKKDCSVRIWNYATRTCELRWHFPGDSPTSVALHPLGYLVAVSFQEKIGFFHVLLRELKLYREVVVSNCRLLRYANGGHLLAAAQGNSVLIFSSKTFSCIATLEGHASRVAAMCFDPPDHTLLTCAADGSVVEWSTLTWQKLHEQTPKASMPREYLSAALWEDGAALCSAFYGSKCFIQTLTHCEQELEQEVDQKCRVTAICRHSTGALFWGTSAGGLWAYTATAAQKAEGRIVARPQGEQGLHAGACNHLCLSADGRTLLTAGDDGAIFILTINGGSHAADEDDVGREAQRQRMMSVAETVLFSRKEIQQRNEELRMLRAENAALGTRLVEEATRLEEECKQKVFEARQKDQAEIHELKRRCRALEQATIAKERESQRVIKEMRETHLQAAEQLDNLYDRKLEHEGDRFAQVQLKHSQLQAEIQDIKEASRQKLVDEATRFKEELTRVMAEKEMEIQKHKDLIAFTQHRFEAMVEQESQEYDVEITETKLNSRRELEQEKQIEAKLRCEQEALLKGLEMMEKDRERAEKEQHDAAQAIADLRMKLEELTRTVNGLKEERDERANTLADKERKIESYKVKVNTLKKFKHILDQRLLEVTESLQPKDHMISQLNEHLRELEVEFEKQLAEQRNIEAAIDQKNQQIALQTSQGKHLQEVIKERDRTIARFQEDVRCLVKETDDMKTWPQEIRRMYHAHVCGQNNREDRLPLEEMQQKMRFAERRVTSLAVQGRQTKSTCKADMQRRAAESATLVQELNQLRINKKQLQQQVRSLQLKLDSIERQPRVGESAENPQMLTASGDAGGSQPVSVERRPTSSPARADATAVAPAMALPRTPSGSLPGPRQQVPHAGMDTSSAATRKLPKSRLTGLGAPGTALHKQKALALQKSSEDDRRLEGLKVAADANTRKLELQKSENRFLKEKLETLLKERKQHEQMQSIGEPGGGVSVGSDKRVLLVDS